MCVMLFLVVIGLQWFITGAIIIPYKNVYVTGLAARIVAILWVVMAVVFCWPSEKKRNTEPSNGRKSSAPLSGTVVPSEQSEEQEGEERKMKRLGLLILPVLMACSQSLAGTTITYTYDKQHRLVSADYSAAQTDAHVAYQYDAANNLDVYVAITDGQYLKSFLWYLSCIPDPVWMFCDVAGFPWPRIWASISVKS